MGAVTAAGAAQRTITFFTSDNGPWLIMGLAGGSAGLLRDGKQTVTHSAAHSLRGTHALRSNPPRRLPCHRVPHD